MGERMCLTARMVSFGETETSRLFWAICILSLETGLKSHLGNVLICAIFGWRAKSQLHL